MAKKKKSALKPVANRGFATTSTPSKRPDGSGTSTPAAQADDVEVGQDSDAKASAQRIFDEEVAPSSSSNTKQNGNTSAAAFSAEDEEDQAVQNIVDRLSERVEKDTARFWKTIEYERRLTKQLPIFELDASVQDEILHSLCDDAKKDTMLTNGAEQQLSAILDELLPGSAASTLLQKALISHAILLRLGFTAEHARDALRHTTDVADVDECVTWLVVALSKDELTAAERRYDGKAEQAEASKSGDDEASYSAGDDTRPPQHGGFQFTRQESNAPAIQSSRQTEASEGTQDLELPKEAAKIVEASVSAAVNLRKALDDRDIIDTLEDPINSYAQARLTVINSDKWLSSIDKSTRRNGKGAPAAVEARKKLSDVKAAARQIVGECQSSPAWNGPAGESTFGHLKMAWEDEEHAREQTAVGTEVGEDSDEDNISLDPADADDGKAEESLFGDLLDEPSNTIQDATTQSTIHLRELPSQALKAQGSRTPRALLNEALRRTHPSANARYEVVATGGRLYRSRLIIRWVTSGKSVTDTYTMTGIATQSQSSADDLLAIAALLCVDTRGAHKSLGAGYREWWDELSEYRKAERNAGSRQYLKLILLALGERLIAENARVGEINRKTKAAAAAANAQDHQGVNGFAEKEDTNVRPFDLESKLDATGAALWRSRTEDAAFQRMLPGRQSLPIAAYKDHILAILAQNQVMVLSGETGCGKSTQVPAYILQDLLEKGRQCKIYVTEPRRISAISLAERVSQELGESRGSVGKGDSLLGSSVRLESNIGRQSRLIYATTGIVLRMLEGSRLEGITHVIVDEVHERSIESDFLLIILKSLMQARKDLKVILMSATLDAERISAYFGGCPTVNVPGRTFPVDVHWLEDAVEMCDYTLEDGSPYARRANKYVGLKDKKLNLASTEAETPDVSSDEEDGDVQSKVTGGAQYRPKTISTLDRLDENVVNPDLIVALLEQMCFGPQHLQDFSAATLIFLPGLAEIRKVYDTLQGHRDFGTKAFQIFALHSTIASEDQSLVFDMPPPGVRKIVISTNIAETGITIPDITCVIDSGKQREMRFDEKRQMSKLVECFVARSSAKQRRGRAGRVQHGVCWHLFTKYRHDNYLAEHPIPEMLRLSLQDLALKLKVMKIKIGNSIEDALCKAMDPPLSANIQRAIASLVEIKALTTTEEITALGRQLSKLPLDVHMGKLLLIACTFNVLDSALTIAAALNAKSPFLTPFGRELEARAAKRSFDAGNSDFVTAVRAFNAWRRATENGVARQFCQRCFLSQTNLIQMEELRQQYMTYLLDAGFVNVDDKTRRELVGGRFRFQSAKTRFMSVPQHLNDNATSLAMVHAAVSASLYPKMLVIDQRNGSLRTLTNNAPASMHPSSVNFKLRLNHVPKGIHHFVYYTIMQSRRLFAWETAAIDDKALLLLCGEADYKFSAQSLYIDRQRLRVTFYELKALLAIKVLRRRLVRILQSSFRNPGQSLSTDDQTCLDLAAKFLGVGANEKDLAII